MTQPRNTRPPRSAIKAKHLYDAEFLKPDGREVMDANLPRWEIVYFHVDKEQAKLLRDYLNNNLQDSEILTGSILVPMMGRRAG